MFLLGFHLFAWFLFSVHGNVGFQFIQEGICGVCVLLLYDSFNDVSAYANPKDILCCEHVVQVCVCDFQPWLFPFKEVFDYLYGSKEGM